MLEAILGQTEGVRYLRKVVEGTFTLPLLLVGEQGTGRRSSVFEAAKEIFDPSQHFALDRGHHPDFRLLQPENDKDIKVDSIRDVLDETRTLPSWAPFKFFVIDGVDRLTDAAANALLKTLEEPPSKTRFFLLTEQFDSVIATIRSRCAVVPYRRLPEDLILSKLRILTEDETKALVCTRMGEGSLGRATRALVAGQLALRDDVLGILNLVASRSRVHLSAVFSAVNELADNLSLGLCFLGQLLRDLLIVSSAPDKVIHLDALQALKRISSQLPAAVIHQLLADLRTLRKRAQGSITLAFHVKASLASALSS